MKKDYSCPIALKFGGSDFAIPWGLLWLMMQIAGESLGQHAHIHFIPIPICMSLFQMPSKGKATGAQPSGAENRKKRKLKEQKDAELAKKMTKISDFWKKRVPQDEESTQQLLSEDYAGECDMYLLQLTYDTYKS